MLKLDKNQLKKILMEEFDYIEIDADNFLKRYPLEIHDNLEEAVKTWLKDRTVLDFEVEGTSIRQVMEARGCHFLMVVGGMNRLFDEDISPEKRKEMAADLKEPIRRW